MSSRFLSVASTALGMVDTSPWEAKELFVTFVLAAGSTTRRSIASRVNFTVCVLLTR